MMTLHITYVYKASVILGDMVVTPLTKSNACVQLCMVYAKHQDNTKRMPRDTRHICFDWTSCFETSMQSRCGSFTFLLVSATRVKQKNCAKEDLVQGSGREPVTRDALRDASKQHPPK